MLLTPSGMKFISGSEERMIRHFAPSLVKTLHGVHFADASDVLYEGPVIEGDGEFHALTIPQKVVALHLACVAVLDRQQTHSTGHWLNGALECLYSWVYYQIIQEIGRSANGRALEPVDRTFFGKAYQQTLGSDRISVTNTSAQNWMNLVNRLAELTVFPTAEITKLATSPIHKQYLVEFPAHDETKLTYAYSAACHYFNNGMPAHALTAAEE